MHFDLHSFIKHTSVYIHMLKSLPRKTCSCFKIPTWTYNTNYLEKNGIAWLTEEKCL